MSERYAATMALPDVPAARQVGRWILLTSGLLQIGALFTPAMRIPHIGTVAFLNVPTAGALLLALAVLTLAVALLRPYGWWRWLSGLLSGAILAVMYWRIVHAPSGTFIDPLLRRTVHPAWGFVAVGVAVFLALAGAASVQPVRRNARA